MEKLTRWWHILRNHWQIGVVRVAFIAILTFAYVIFYSKIALDYEIGNQWKGYQSIQNLMKDISAFIPIAGVFAAIHAAEVEVIMVFSEIYKNIREKRDLKIKMESIAVGEAQERQRWAKFWSEQQETVKPEAEAESITPDEPSPTPPEEDPKNNSKS